MKQNNDTTFLAKWLSGELSDSELKEFESSSEYQEYLAITKALEHAEFPDYDVEANLNATFHKIDSQEQKKVKRLIPYWAIGIAASLVLCLGIYTFFNTKNYTTQLAEQLQFELPDGSEVTLNSASNIEFAALNWKKNRELSLQGEAYFNVKKGQTFTVNTTYGEVTVLGTSFTVNARDNYFNVICYHGKVKVTTTNNESIILTKGKAFSVQKNQKENYTIQHTTPEWLSDQSSFYNVSIFEVVQEIERQYNITISGKQNLKQAYFTGRFSHTNLNTALKTVFTAMGIPYSLDRNKNVVIQNY